MTVETQSPEQQAESERKYEQSLRDLDARNAPYLRDYDEMIDNLVEARKTQKDYEFKSTLAKLVHSLPPASGTNDRYFRRVALQNFAWPEGFVYELNRYDLMARITSRCADMTTLSVEVFKMAEDVSRMETLLKVITS